MWEWLFVNLEIKDIYVQSILFNWNGHVKDFKFYEKYK